LRNPAERAPAPQHAERFGPHRTHLRHEEVGDGTEDEVKAPVEENRGVDHIALGRTQREPLALGDEPVLRQLPRRVVEDGDVCARRREYRGLLPAARGEAEDVGAFEIRKPIPRNRLVSVSKISHRPPLAASMTPGRR